MEKRDFGKTLILVDPKGLIKSQLLDNQLSRKEAHPRAGDGRAVAEEGHRHVRRRHGGHDRDLTERRHRRRADSGAAEGPRRPFRRAGSEKIKGAIKDTKLLQPAAGDVAATIVVIDVLVGLPRPTTKDLQVAQDLYGVSP